MIRAGIVESGQGYSQVDIGEFLEFDLVFLCIGRFHLNGCLFEGEEAEAVFRSQGFELIGVADAGQANLREGPIVARGVQEGIQGDAQVLLSLAGGAKGLTFVFEKADIFQTQELVRFVLDGIDHLLDFLLFDEPGVEADDEGAPDLLMLELGAVVLKLERVTAGVVGEGLGDGDATEKADSVAVV